jgi:hypothetical protein
MTVYGRGQAGDCFGWERFRARIEGCSGDRLVHHGYGLADSWDASGVCPVMVLILCGLGCFFAVLFAPMWIVVPVLVGLFGLEFLFLFKKDHDKLQ